MNLAEYATRRADKFAATIATLEAGIAARAAEGLARADFPREAQKQAAPKMAAKARAEVTQASDAARWETLNELNAAAESLALTASLYASPVVVLSWQGLGSPDRSAFQMQVASAGPTELANLATFAIATQYRTLGAALLSVLDAMPARSRTFSAVELADKLCGDEARAILASVEAGRLRELPDRGRRGGRDLCRRAAGAVMTPQETSAAEAEARIVEGYHVLLSENCASPVPRSSPTRTRTTMTSGARAAT